MGTCVRCGISGPFVKVDDQGLCAICRNRAAKTNPSPAPSPKKPLLDAQKVIDRYLKTPHNTYPSEFNVVDYYVAEFECMLSSLPEVSIERIPCDAPAGEAECVILKKFCGCSPWDLGNFVAVDTETSSIGFSAEIVEVSAVKFENFRPTQVFQTLCKPYRRISLEATAVNGITNEMVRNAPRFAEIIPALDEFCDGFSLVAHNAPFDLRVLAKEGFPTAGRRVFDTLPLARATLRDKDGNKLPGYKLAECCKYCAILFSGAHRSTADAFAAGLLFLELVKRNFGIDDLTAREGLWNS